MSCDLGCVGCCFCCFCCFCCCAQCPFGIYSSNYKGERALTSHMHQFILTQFPSRQPISIQMVITKQDLTAMHLNMSQSGIDPFQTTKFQILKQKYEYMTHYLAETEARVNAARANNRKLRARAEELEEEACTPSSSGGRAGLEARMRTWREEEREKTRRIDELKKLISEYKYLCQEAIKISSPANSQSHKANQSTARQPLLESARENSFFSQMDCSQNQNSNNVSMTRNKSYQKVKTKLFCDKCSTDYQPNEYYRHLKDCGVAPNDSLLSKSNPKDKTGKGYRTMRN